MVSPTCKSTSEVNILMKGFTTFDTTLKQFLNLELTWCSNNVTYFQVD